MKLVHRIIAVAVTVAVSTAITDAQNLLSVKIGPSWPRELLGGEKPTAWDASIDVGRMIERVGLGLTIDFLWNRWEEREKVTDPTSQTSKYKVTQKEQSYKFPLSAFLLIDPVPHLIVHPVIRGQIGFDMMVFSHYKDTLQSLASPDEEEATDRGFYIGLLREIGLEAVYDMGEQVSAFLGVEYQWSNTRKRDDKEGEFFERNMSNPHIYLGFRFLL